MGSYKRKLTKRKRIFVLKERGFLSFFQKNFLTSNAGLGIEFCVNPPHRKSLMNRSIKFLFITIIFPKYSLGKMNIENANSICQLSSFSNP